MDYKEYLDKARIKQLAELQARYNQVYAKERAEAASSLIAGHRQLRRGLQNVGLAGRKGNLISGREKTAALEARRRYREYNAGLSRAANTFTTAAGQRMARQAIDDENRVKRAEAYAKWGDEYAAAKAEAEKEYAAKLEEAKQEHLQYAQEYQNSYNAYLAQQAQYQAWLQQQAAAQQSAQQELIDPRFQGNNMQQAKQDLMAARAEQQRLQMQQMAQNGVDPRQNAAFNTQQGKVNYVSALAAARQQAVENELRNNDIDPRFAQNSMMQQTKPQASAIAASRRYEAVQAQYEQNLNEWREKIQRAEGITKPKTRNEYDKWHEAQVARQHMIDYERRVAALKYPAISNLITLSDSEFAMRYDAAEKAYKQAVQNAQILRKDSSSSMDDLSSEANDIEGKATAEFVKWQNAAHARDDAMGAFYNESVNTNMKLVPHAPTWASEKDHDGKNYTAAMQNHWDATQYARSHDTDGSKYMPLVNEWSFINGRTALNYTQTHAVSNFVNNAASGGKKTQQYNAFVANCAAAFYNQPEGLTKNEREKMEAMLTLANLMTDEERARFNTILRQGGGKEADKYFEYLYASVLPQRFDSYVNNEMEFQTRDGIGKVFESVISIPVNLAQGVSGVIHTLSTGQEDPIAAKLAATKYNLAQGARDAVGQGISSSITNALMNAGTAEDFAQWAGSAGNFLYGTGMSMADSATVAAISAGIGSVFQGAGLAAETASRIGSAIGGSLLGASAFNSSYQEALDNGLDPQKARITAIGNGLNEMIFETLSIGTLLEKTGKSVIKVGKSTFVNWLVNTAVQAGVEGSEEVFTDIGNKIWDNRINGIFSEEMQKIREYVASGMSFNEAKEKVRREFAEQLGMSFLGGAISGGFMGGGAQFVNMISNRQLEAYGKTLSQEHIDDLKKYEYKSEQAQEILNSGTITNTDAAMLDIIHTQELVEESINYVEQAVAEGKMPQEIADIYKKFAEHNVQTETNPDGITDEEAEKMLPYVDTIKNAEAIKQGLGKIVEQQTAARKEFDALSFEQKQQRLQNIANETTALRNAPSLRVGASESRLSGQSAAQEFTTRAKTDTITLNNDGSVKTANGSVTFDFGANKTVDAMTDNQARAIRFAAAVANKTGVNIKVEQEFVGDDRNKNGEYNPETNTIRVNLSGTNSAIYTMSHELTHYLQSNNKQAFADLSKAIQKQLSRTDLVGSDLPSDYQDIIGDYLTGDNTLFEALCAYEKERYAKEKINLTQAQVEEEVIARCCESFLGNSSLIADMTQNHTKSARAVYRFLNEIRADINALRADASERMAERGYASDFSPEQGMLEQFADIDKIVKLWENGLRKAAKTQTSARNKTNEDTKYSFRGRDALYSKPGSLDLNDLRDKQGMENLKTAYTMDRRGIDSEKIRLATGWFKGYDGKWRNEIDDSEAKLADWLVLGKGVRYMEEKARKTAFDLYDKIDSLENRLKKSNKVNGADSEQSKALRKELRKTRKQREEAADFSHSIAINRIKLSDILDHAKLYENYPQLKDVTVHLDYSDRTGYLGSASGTTDITITTDRNSKEEILQTLMHEVQHIIQEIEGFAKGANVEYWADRNKRESADVKESKATLAQVERELARVKYDGNPQASPLKSAVSYAYITDLLRTDKPGTANYAYDIEQKEKYEKRAEEGGYADLLKKYLIAYQDVKVAEMEAKDYTKAFADYQRTAGEVEARDVASRLRMSEDERKATRPDIDRSDVKYIEDEKMASLSDKQYLDLAKRYESGDKAAEAELRKAVDAAAKAAGYNEHGFHRTSANFYIFDRAKQGTRFGGYSRLGKGFYFAHEYFDTQQYSDGSRVIEAYLSMKKPYDGRKPMTEDIKAKVDEYYKNKEQNGYDPTYPISKEQFLKNLEWEKAVDIGTPSLFLDHFKYDKNGKMTDGVRDFLESMGYDGIITDNEMVVFDPSQIKSADLITKDDNGNIIPLSERFKTDRTGEDAWKNEDIRYSLNVGEERAVKIADGKKGDATVSFIDLLLDGQKTGETRPSKGSIKPNAWVGIYNDGKVYGRVKFGEPKWITKQDAEYKTSYIEGTNYDIDDSVGGKWYYPVLDKQDFRDNPIPTNRAGQWGAAYNTPMGEVITNESGDPVMKVTDNGNSTMLSLSTYEKDGRATLKDWLKKQQSKKRISKEDAQYIIDQMEKVYNIATKYEDKYAAFGAWSRAEVTRDKFGKPVFSVIRANGEYPMNLDFSLVCVKRRALDAVLNEIVKSGYMDKLVLDGEALVKVNETIRRHGFETACMGCFVEAKRFRQQGVAETFVGKYNDLVKSLGRDDVSHFNFAKDETIADSEGIVNVPDKELDFTRINELVNQYKAKKKANPSAGQTVEEAIAMELKMNPSSRRLVDVGDFMSTRGMDAVAKDAPSVLTLYNKQKGTGGPKAVFGDMQYLNDVERRYQWTPEKAYKVGGVRVQSFSDFVPRMFFDYCQMVADLSAKKLPAHAYTKEESFVKLFGLTGMKINMSLFPKIANDGLAAGLMYKRSADGDIVFENGEPVITYAWAGESFDYETAKQIQADAKYGKNCGTIAVGISDEHIARMLDDPTIRMIIPYHKSSLNPVVAEMMGIDGFTDYTDQQRTKKDGKAIDVDFAFNQRLHEVGDPKAVVKEYLAWCEKNGYTPKFEQFKDNENYYKLLEDFALYDEQGNYCAQEAVKMVYPEQGDAFGSMDTLLDEYLKRDNDLQEARDAMVPMLAQEIIRQTDKKASLAVPEATLGESLGKDYLKYLQLGTKVVNQTATEDEIRDFKRRMNALSQDNREAFLDKLREKLIRDDEGAKVRAVRDRQIAALKEELKQARERRAADREARKRDDIKRKIQKGSAKITQMLAHPTEARHVPVPLAKEVIEFMTMLNDFMNATVKKDAAEPMTKRGKAIAEKLKQVYDESFTDQETIKKAQEENPEYNPLGHKINEAFKDIMLSDMIKVVGDVISEKSVDNLTSDELDLINQVLRGVTRTVLDANKLVQSQIKEDAQEAGLQMMSELRANEKMNRAIRFYLEESLDLRRIARIFSRSNDDAVFVKLANELNEGAIEKERIAQALQRIFDPVTEKYGDEIRKWYGKDAEWIDTGIVYKGREVRITKGMRVSLALHVLNEGNMKHIKNGGITIPDEQLYKKGHLKEAYADEQGSHLVRLDEEDINKIISDMTDAEKAYLEVAKDFFHNRTGYYINRTSLATVGYSKAMVKNYFPIHTDGMFNIKDLAQYFMQNGSVEGFGFLKDRVSGSNPILLEDITSVINRQIKGVSLYAGLAPAVRNWNAVLNAQEWEKVTEYDKEKKENKKVWRPFSSVEKTMTTVMGAEGVKVVKGFLADVQELNHVDVTPMERFAGKLATNYVKAVLLGNLKVAMKQVASYPTAAAVIPWKYLGKALLKGGRSGRMISRADVDLINQYTPLYQMRREGNANEIASIMQKRGMEQKLPWLLGWITKMDVMTVGRLWSAAEYMVADQQNLPVGSDEYYKAVAKVFNDTIQQTQPNFTPLQRNAALRSKNPVVRSLVLFGTQRMQNGGILVEAAMELKHSKGKSKAEIKAAKMKLGRAVASQIVQNILLIVASIGVDALRGRMKGWQDDDKEITAASLAKGMGDMFLSNFIGSFLGGSETYSLFSGLFKKAMGETAYDTEFTVPALDAVETLINFAQSDVPDAIKYLLGDHTDEEKQKKAINFSYQLAKAFGYATGIPLENALKDVFKGIIPAIEDIRDAVNTGELIPWLHQSGKLDKAKTAANYKAWTKAGYSGRDYFYWEKQLNGVSGGRDGRIPILLDSDLTNEQKALMMQMFDTADGYADGTVFYNKKGEAIIDFTAPSEKQQALPKPNAEPSEAPNAEPTAEPTPKPTENPLTEARQEGVQAAVKLGVPEQTAFDAFLAYQNMGKNKDESDGYSRNDEFREWLFKNVDSPEQMAVLEYQVIGQASSVKGAITYRDSGVVYRDYTNASWFKLSEHNLSKDGTNKRYEAGKQLEKTGMKVDKTVAIYDGLKELTKKAEWIDYLKNQNLTDDQIRIFLWSRGWKY